MLASIGSLRFQMASTKPSAPPSTHAALFRQRDPPSLSSPATSKTCEYRASCPNPTPRSHSLQYHPHLRPRPLPQSGHQAPPPSPAHFLPVPTAPESCSPHLQAASYMHSTDAPRAQTNPHYPRASNLLAQAAPQPSPAPPVDLQ